MRKLVTIRQITAITPIEKADAIETALVDGWEVVVKKGEFLVGDFVLYFEIDCLLPMSDIRFSFLAKGNDIDKFRLRTIKLRGQISQGLVLPLSQFPECKELDIAYEGVLGIDKYEIPDSGNVRGCKPASTFPHFIPKTDEERIQNIYNKYKENFLDVDFYESEKLDGSSVTIASLIDPKLFIDKLKEEDYPYSCEDSQLILASRNQTLKFDATSYFWKGVLNTGLQNKALAIAKTGRQLALQGELLGPGIQGNREGLLDYTVRVFKVYDIDNKEYLTHPEFLSLCREFNIETVPQLGKVKVFNMELPNIIKRAQGKNSNSKNIEGKVYTAYVNNNTVHFKVINNQYLLEKDK